MKKKKYHLPKSSFLAVKIGIRIILRLSRVQICNWFHAVKISSQTVDPNADNVSMSFYGVCMENNDKFAEFFVNPVRVGSSCSSPITAIRKQLIYLSSSKSEDWSDTNLYSQKRRFRQVIFFLLHFSPERKLNFETNYVWKFSSLT